MPSIRLCVHRMEPRPEEIAALAAGSELVVKPGAAAQFPGLNSGICTPNVIVVHGVGKDPGFLPGRRSGGKEDVAAQVRHHLPTFSTLSLPYLTHGGYWLQWRALPLLFGCVVARRLSSERWSAGHTADPG